MKKIVYESLNEFRKIQENTGTPPGELDDDAKAFVQAAYEGNEEHLKNVITRFGEHTILAAWLFNEYTDGRSLIEMAISAADNGGNEDLVASLQEFSKDLKAKINMTETDQKPKDYATMGKSELHDVINKAIEDDDYDTLKEIRPFIKESSAITRIIDFMLNEEKA